MKYNLIKFDNYLFMFMLATSPLYHSLSPSEANIERRKTSNSPPPRHAASHRVFIFYAFIAAYNNEFMKLSN